MCELGHVDIQIHEQLVDINVTVTTGVDFLKYFVESSNIPYKTKSKSIHGKRTSIINNYCFISHLRYCRSIISEN